MITDNSLLSTLFLAVLLALPRSASAELPAPQSLEAAGASFPMIEAGEGSIVLFVHGAVGDYRVFEPVWAATAKDHRAVAYTQRWFGTSDWPAEPPFGPDIHAADLVEILTALGEPATVVAWSYGADVALRGAAMAPDLFRSLVLYEPNDWGVILDAPEGEAALGALGDGFADTDAAIEAEDHEEAARELIETVFGLEEGEFSTLPPANQAIVLDSAKTVAMLWNGSDRVPLLVCDDLATIAAPTLVVAGSKTVPAFALAAKATARCLPDAELAIIEGVGHDGPISAGDALATLMLDFIDRH